MEASKVYYTDFRCPVGTSLLEKLRRVCIAAGIKDIRTKCLRSNTAVNVVAATFEGLKALRTPEEVARTRGKSVDEIIG